DVRFWNPGTGKYEYLNDDNENKLYYTLAKKGRLEEGEINIVTGAFIAQAYANFLIHKQERLNIENNNTLVGFDTRYFSPEIGEMLTRILAGNGFRVFRNKDNAPSPTPVNSSLTYILGCIGSLNVTASHNPADQNGIKPNNEKGHLDSDDDLEIFLDFVEKMYNNGIGNGTIEIAPCGKNVDIIDFDELYLKKIMDPMMENGFVNLDLIRNALHAGWGFIVDGIGGTGGIMMEKIFNHLFGNAWHENIHIINKKYDPSMLGIPKPDPTKPAVLEESGLLRAMTIYPNISTGGTGDNDWDRFTAAVKIDGADIKKAQKLGLFVSKHGKTWLVRFTADQIYTLFGEYQLRKIAHEKCPEIDEEQLDEAIKSKKIDLSNCYIITTYPSSILTNYLADYYGASLIYTSVGFKNIGITVVKKLENEIGENFKPIYVIGKEESGGNGFGLLNGFILDYNGNPWIGIKDKDTSLNVLKIMEISADIYMRKIRSEETKENGIKTILDLYSRMLDRLGVLTYYERLDWYTRAKEGKDKDKKSDDVKLKLAKKADDLEKELDPNGKNENNVAKIAQLFNSKLAEGKQGEIKEEPNSFLWVKIATQDITFPDGEKIRSGEPIYSRVYDTSEKKPAQVKGKWDFIKVKSREYRLKDGRYFTIFHAGEGPKITLYDKNCKPIYWTLIRPSGTEVGLIRHYNEIIFPK
ncbi:hypothetical protein FJZ33_09185, partial [Candidatus Poribacteria bacterium]|nr:hypothetical protein [Candidatus Poribacteria bacterium]